MPSGRMEAVGCPTGRDASIAIPFGPGNPPSPTGQITRQQTALEGKRCSLVGMLPRHRFATLEIESCFDPLFSADWLTLKFKRLDWASGDVVECESRVCRALPLLQDSSERDAYVRELCLMIGPHLRAGERTLKDLDRVLTAACQRWDLLEVFRALRGQLA